MGFFGFVFYPSLEQYFHLPIPIESFSNVSDSGSCIIIFLNTCEVLILSS